MTALHDYPTPRTDAQAEHEWHHLATVPASYARDLERKLALCRDAMAGIVALGEAMPEPSEETEIAIAALDATK